MMFLALRNRIGNENFTKALRQFWLQYQFKEASFKDLRQAFEKSSGENLSSFFEQWLNQTGASRYSLNSAFFDGKKLHVTIGQSLTNNKMRLPLRVYSVEAQEDFLLDHTGKQFKAILTPRLQPLTLSIDPDFTVWRALAPEEAPPILREAVVSKRLAMLVLNDTLATAALSFTKEFAEGEVEKISIRQAMKEKFVIVFGKAQEIETWLVRSKLPHRPTLVSEGDTQVWMINPPTKHVLVVSVPDQDEKAQFSLETVGKRLPHLARYSWVTFENGQTKLRGTWPVESPHTLIKDKSG